MAKIFNRGAMVGFLMIALFFVASLFLYLGATGPQPVQAAVITPVVNVGRDGSRLVTFFQARTLTADTRQCFDLSDMEIIDLQYNVDMTLGNATTVSLQQTNIDATSGPFNTADVIATVPATPADADVMKEAAVFGRWNCVFVDLTNSNPISITVLGVAK